MEYNENNMQKDIYSDLTKFTDTDLIINKVNDPSKDFNYKYNKASTLVKTGDIPDGGVYSCTNCGTDINIVKGSRMPACPRCGNTLFSLVI